MSETPTTASENDLLVAARNYRNAVRIAEAVWIANGRRGASESAVSAVNHARLRAQQLHDELLRVINELDGQEQRT